MTATDADLFSLVQTGEFREDLFYRFNVICFVIPPLRERPEDIPLMFQSLPVTAYARPKRLRCRTRRAERLVEYSWPGNITELRTVTKKAQRTRLPELIEPGAPTLPHRRLTGSSDRDRLAVVIDAAGRARAPQSI